MSRLFRYLVGLSIAANQLANALTGGDPGQTVSSRAAIARLRGSKLAAVECSVLNRMDFHHERKGEDHCTKALRHLMERDAHEAAILDNTKGR